jgi:hypothetical protein
MEGSHRQKPSEPTKLMACIFETDGTGVVITWANEGNMAMHICMHILHACIALVFLFVYRRTPQCIVGFATACHGICLFVGESFSSSVTTFKSTGTTEQVAEMNVRDLCQDNGWDYFSSGLI